MRQPHDHPLIGRTITGVIARPGSAGEDIVLLQFDDGTCFELVSAPSRRSLRRLARCDGRAGASQEPTDGDRCRGEGRAPLGRRNRAARHGPQLPMFGPDPAFA